MRRAWKYRRPDYHYVFEKEIHGSPEFAQSSQAFCIFSYVEKAIHEMPCFENLLVKRALRAFAEELRIRQAFEFKVSFF